MTVLRARQSELGVLRCAEDTAGVCVNSVPRCGRKQGAAAARVVAGGNAAWWMGRGKEEKGRDGGGGKRRAGGTPLVLLLLRARVVAWRVRIAII